MNEIKISKSEQYLHEVQTWRRVLEFFKDENFFLKTRLATVVDQSTDKNFLELAEQFQNRFITKDVYINELRNEINSQEKKLKDAHETGTKQKSILNKQTKLRNEIEFFEKEFNKLKNEFNKCLDTLL